MVKLQEYKGQFFITIPREHVADKGWKKGQNIVIGFDVNGDILLRAIKKK